MRPLNNKEAWKLKHSDARIFYETYQDKIMDLWQRIKGDKELRPSLWLKFVDSEELWNMAFKKLVILSRDFLDIAAFSEDPSDGISLNTIEGEIYRLLPTESALLDFNALGSANLLFDVMFKTPHYACQQFLKTVLIYVFADVYPKKFYVEYKTHEVMLVDQNTINIPLLITAKL